MSKNSPSHGIPPCVLKFEEVHEPFSIYFKHTIVFWIFDISDAMREDNFYNKPKSCTSKHGRSTCSTLVVNTRLFSLDTIFCDYAINRIMGCEIKIKDYDVVGI